MFESRRDVGRDQRPPIERHPLKWVEGDRVREISGVEVDNVIGARRRYGVGHVARQIAVRIEQGEPASAGEVRDHHIE